MPTLLEVSTAVTFVPYAPVSVIASNETAARIPAYSTAMRYMVRARRRSVNDSPDRAQQPLDVLGRRRAGVRARAGALRDLRGDVREIRVRDAEIAKALEPAEPRELLDAARTVTHADRRLQRGDGVRHDRLVEAQCRREAERIEGAV